MRGACPRLIRAAARTRSRVSSATWLTFRSTLAEPLATRLRRAADVEGKIVARPRGAGPAGGPDVALVDLPGGLLRDRLTAAGSTARPPRQLTRPAARSTWQTRASTRVVDALVGFRGVTERRSSPRRTASCDPAAGCSWSTTTAATTCPRCVDADRPEYRAWSRRDGPFLRGAGSRSASSTASGRSTRSRRRRAFLDEAFGSAAGPWAPPQAAAAVAGTSRSTTAGAAACAPERTGGWPRRRSARRPRPRPAVPATLAPMSYPTRARSARSRARDAAGAGRRRGPHLGPFRITPLRVTLVIALAAASRSSAYVDPRPRPAPGAADGDRLRGARDRVRRSSRSCASARRRAGGP